MVTKMPIAKIADVADVVICLSANSNSVEVVEIGAKPGEKLYEELVNDEEVRRTYSDENFLYVLPAFAKDHESRFPYISSMKKVTKVFNSSVERALSRSELEDFFLSQGVMSGL